MKNATSDKRDTIKIGTNSKIPNLLLMLTNTCQVLMNPAVYGTDSDTNTMR